MSRIKLRNMSDIKIEEKVIKQDIKEETQEDSEDAGKSGIKVLNLKNKLNSVLKTSENDNNRLEITNMKNKLSNILNTSSDNIAGSSGPLLGNMKNKLNSLLKLPNTSSSDNPLKRKIYAPDVNNLKTSESSLNLNALKLNLNKKIKPIDEGIPEKPLNLLNLKNKLGSALKLVLKTESEDQKEITPVKKTKRRFFTKYLMGPSHYAIDRKNGIFYCKICSIYYVNLFTLEKHVKRHMRDICKKKPKKNIPKIEEKEVVKRNYEKNRDIKRDFGKTRTVQILR